MNLNNGREERGCAIKIPKAIEILVLDKTCDFEGDAKDLEDALQLGIEALKRCRTLAQESPLWALHPLPGETKE